MRPGKAAGKDAFGRADMPQAIQTALSLPSRFSRPFTTMGGVKIDTKAEVLNPAGHTILVSLRPVKSRAASMAATASAATLRG